MYFNRTLEDWIGFKIDKRTKFDLTISSGLALLAAQKPKEKERSNFQEKVFLENIRSSPYLLYLQNTPIVLSTNELHKQQA